MKLSSALVERTLTQYEGRPIPDSHPAIPQLANAFGDHTFFLDGKGLNIVEPTPAPDGTLTGKVVNLATWKDSARTSLLPHEPEPTDVVVMLGPEDRGEPA